MRRRPSACWASHGIEAPSTCVLGIPVQVDCPAVGGNLREHLLYMLQWRLEGQPAARTATTRAAAGRPCAARRRNEDRHLRAADRDPVGGFFFGHALAARWSDVELLLAPFSLDFGAGRAASVAGLPDVQLHGLRPGEPRPPATTTTASRPTSTPTTSWCAPDQAVAIGSMRMLRRIAASTSLADLIEQEDLAGATCASDDDLLDAYRHGELLPRPRQLAAWAPMPAAWSIHTAARALCRRPARDGPVDHTDDGRGQHQRTRDGHGVARGRHRPAGKLDASAIPIFVANQDIYLMDGGGRRAAQPAGTATIA